MIYSIYWKKKDKEVMKMNTKRIIGMLLTITFIIMMFWFAASYFDVIAHNLDEEPIYHGWNFFKLLVENL